MPAYEWKGIEDDSRIPPPVWLIKTGGDDAATVVWKPLRKCDCRTLNRTSSEHEILIEFGRKTANLQDRVVSHNFVPSAPTYSLCSSIWFMREERKKEIILHPVEDVFDTAAIESLYHRAREVIDNKGDVFALTKEVIVLKDGASKVQVSKSGNSLSLKYIPSGSWFFTNSVELQRGYGDYEVPGEETELALGPVCHVVFVIHGIGEAFFSREAVQIAGLIEQVETARMQIQQKQLDQWTKSRSDNKIASSPPPRIEFIPIEWFSSVHDESSILMRSLKATTLPTIPALRAIANDVVFDVLMYLTPNFCQHVLETVTRKLRLMHERFHEINPSFRRSGGSFSLAGHSLGSVICWDLLAILKRHNEASSTQSRPLGDPYGAAGDWGPPVTMKDTIPFQPEHTFFLGSPLGMFLTLRGSHPVLDGMDKTENGVSTFVLPTKGLYNIFHPSDPVAYRIEPLLLPQATKEDDIPPSIYLTVPGESVRLHVKAKQLGDIVRKSLLKPSGGGWSSLVDGAINLAAETTSAVINADSEASAAAPDWIFPLGGTNQRVDLSLQPNLIDNEYVRYVLPSCHFTRAVYI